MPTRKNDLLSWVGTALLALLVYLAVEMRADIKALSAALPIVTARVDVVETNSRNHVARLDAQNTRIGRIEDLFIRRPAQ